MYESFILSTKQGLNICVVFETSSKMTFLLRIIIFFARIAGFVKTTYISDIPTKIAYIETTSIKDIYTRTTSIGRANNAYNKTTSIKNTYNKDICLSDV